MSLYRITPGSKASGGSGPPLASDVNQYADVLAGDADAGSLSLAAPIASPSSAGSASLAAGTELGVGTYTYALTFCTGVKRDDGTYTINGETTASSTWTATTTTGNQRVSHTSLATSAEATVVAKRLYRTAVGGVQLKLVATLPVAQTTYSDSTADGSLGANVPTSNTTGTYISNNEPTASAHTATKNYVDATTKGESSSDIIEIQALVLSTNTCSWTATTWDATNTDLPTHIDIKDGSTAVATVDVVYNSAGKPTTYTIAAGGKTVTITQTFNSDTQFASRSVTVA